MRSALLAAVALAAPTPPMVLETTSYCPGSSGEITASGQHVHPGVAANNMLPLGTVIRISPRAFGRSVWTVLDRIGWGSQLDLWSASCTASIQFGRRLERVTVVGRRAR